MKLSIVLLISAVVIVGLGALFFQEQNEATVADLSDVTQESSEVESGEAMESITAMEANSETMEGVMMAKDPAEQKSGSYEQYAPEKLSHAADGDVVLFFRAPWCPTCRALASDLEKNRSQIPQGLTILDVSYDTQTELKQKYGVTYQHTLVQVDADGTMISKWTGSLDLDALVMQVQ